MCTSSTSVWSTILPLQPNQTPPVLFNTSASATASPPAAVLRGSASRFDTTTSRLTAPPRPRKSVGRGRSYHRVPARGQAHGCIDETHHGVGLRKVAPHLVCVRI